MRLIIIVLIILFLLLQVDIWIKKDGYKRKIELTEMIEISKHPWFLGCQFHPEFTSNPRDGHPIFNDFIAKAIKIKR